MGRLAKERMHGPAKVLHVGDVIRVYDSSGQPFTGRVSAVEHHAVPFLDHQAFGVICVPLDATASG